MSVITRFMMQDNIETEMETSKKSVEPPVASRTRRLSNVSLKDNTEGIDGTKVAASCFGLDQMGPDNVIKDPTIKKIAEIYQKNPLERNEQEVDILNRYLHLIPSAENYLKSKREKELLRQRLLEVEESCESIEAKAEILAKLIIESRHTVIYTGAGISTSASIPDYRGPNGLWTQIKRTGTFSITKVHDLSNAEPTYTHMAIKELCRRRVVKHVVSQNCDGLHFRSGMIQNNLSEIHGNMYIEVCPACETQYFREADVTQQTSRFRHKTGRRCHTCQGSDNNLIDTIVLYGERSRTKWPMNWERAEKAAKNADLIICMGSSLKTLRRYSCLWPSSTSTKKTKSDTKLVIINLQHTPKDKNAFMKINGKCDFVMENVMQRLGIDVPAYDWSNDPLLRLAVPFTSDELAKLKRNLIFDSRKYNSFSNKYPSRDTSLSPITSKRSRSDENRSSPSLFVSELTDDPDKKRLRMRIRAVNVSSTEPCNVIESDTATPSNGQQVPDNNCDMTTLNDPKEREGKIKLESEEYDFENLSHLKDKNNHDQLQRVIEYSPPGWLGKSLGYSKASSYRRKRHGNKGRKRLTATVSVEPSLATKVPAIVPQ